MASRYLVKEDKCCMNCRYCLHDFSTDTIECLNDGHGEWVKQESEDYYAPQNDYCTDYEHDDQLDDDFWRVACSIL